MELNELIDLYNHNYINYVEHSFTNDSGAKCVEIVAASSDDSDGVRSVIFSRDDEADKWRQISDLEYASFEQYYIINISNKNAVDYKFKKYLLCKRRKFDIYKFAKFINYNSDYYDNITNYSYMICDYGKAIEELNADKEDHHLTDDERKQYQESIDKGIVIYNCCGEEFVGYAKKNGGILNNELISITTTFDGGLYERIFKQVNGNGPHKQLLSFKIFEYKTLDEYYNAMKALYSRNNMDAKVEKIIHEE